MDTVKIQFLECGGLEDIVAYEREILFTRGEILRIFQLALDHNIDHPLIIKFFYNGSFCFYTYYVDDMTSDTLYDEIQEFIHNYYFQI